jgi:predicted nucleotidyltransferase
MDAIPILARVAQLLEREGLDAVLIGNAAAALQGAPVTTVDLDFMFRRTPANVRKLTAIAAELDAMLMKPHYPVSGLLRICRDEDGLQVDFMGEIRGVRSFEGLKKRAQEIQIGNTRVRIASLADIIRSKKAARRPRDLAVLPILEKALEESTRHPKGPAGSS